MWTITLFDKRGLLCRRVKRVFFLLFLFLMVTPGNIENSEDDSVEHVITVDGTNLRFYPASLTINEGDTVRFMWGEEILPHNSVEENGVFDSGEPEREVNYSYTFGYDEEGVYDFFCEPHEAVGMDGTITVLDKEKLIETSSKQNNNKDSGGSQIIALLILVAVAICVIFIIKTRKNGNEIVDAILFEES